MTIPQAMQRAATAYTRGEWAESERWCRQILAARADHSDALNLLGIIAAQTGRVAEAARLLQRVVAANPGEAMAHNNYGNVLRELERLDDALQSYERALQIKPDYAEALRNRGNTLVGLKRLEEALASYDRALALTDHAETFYNRGNTLAGLKRLEEALASYERALALRPGHAEAHNNRGNALQELQRPEEALACYDRALALRPEHAEAHNNRGNALKTLQRLEEALECYDRALALRPGYAEAHNNRGNALKMLLRLEEALECYDRALALRPGYAEALNNRGLALKELQRLEEALECYDRALALRPGYADASYNRGLAALLRGDFPSGWSGYESRWDQTDAVPRKLAARFPLWKGGDVSGRKIIVYEEQGLGDVIQFCRYLRLLAASGAQVTFFVGASLLRLLRSLDPSVRVLADCPVGESFDYQSPLLSLPRAFGTGPRSIPADTPYLRAEPERVRKWRERLGRQGFKIGIAWQGNKTARIDHGRSFALAQFRGLSQLPNVRLISLQKNAGVEQLRELAAGMKVETLGEDYDAGEDAFLDAAAVMESLDLVISSDTSIAHLAGALGRPVWVALKHVPDWRWQLDRTDSPWYPTMRLFRQRARGDWQGVFSQIEATLVPLLRVVGDSADGTARVP